MSGIVPGLTKPVSGTPLSTYTEGSIIKINESGSPVEFYVAKHDYEAGLNGAGRTLVVRKDCPTTSMWVLEGNEYQNSTLDTYFNSIYKNQLSVSLRNQIGTTKFYYTSSSGSVSALERAIFALSGTELGKTDSKMNTEGTALIVASLLQIVYLQGVATAQWTRSPRNEESNYAFALDTDTKLLMTSTSSRYGARPCFTLPSTILIDKNGQVIE